MPKYRCPCGADGFDNLYDLQRHALKEHGRNVEAIAYKTVNQEASVKRGQMNARKFFICGDGP